MPSRVRLHLLGQPRLYDARQSGAGALPLGKPFALLVYLVVTGTAAERDELARLLWTHAPRERARSSLRQALWLLRKHLGPDTFTSDDPVRLAAGAFTSDITEFERALADDDLERAERLWKGAPLAGLAIVDAPSWNEWSDCLRARLEGAFADALVRHAEGRRAGGDYEGAIRLFQRALTVVSFRGDVHARLFDLLLATRQFTAAEELIEEWRGQDWAASEVDVDGMAERLAALRQAQAVEAAPERFRTEFVGATHHFADLLERWRAARRGRLAVACLTGPPGIGKTRLTEEVAAAVQHDGGCVARVKAAEIEAGAEWAVAAEVARQLLALPGAAGVGPATDRLLTALLPSRERRAGQWPATDRITAVAFADALRDLILAVSEEHPLLLIVDDLHWSDPQSRTVLARVLRQLRDASCLALLTFRSDEVGASLRRMVDLVVRELGGRSVRLEPLGEAEVSELLSLTADFASPDDVVMVANRIWNTTRGNPLFVAELLRSLRDDEVITVAGEHRRFHVERLPSRLELPRTVHELLEQKLRRLSPPSAQLLAAAAAISPRVPISRLRQECELSEGEFTRALSESIEAEVLQWLGGERVDFTHDELRGTVRRTYPAPTRSVGRMRRRLAWSAAAVAAALFVFLPYLLTSDGRASDDGPGFSDYGGGTIIMRTAQGAVSLRAAPRPLPEWPVADVDLPNGILVPARAFDGRLRWFANIRPARINDPPYGAELLDDGTYRPVVRGDGDIGINSASPGARYIVYSSENTAAPSYRLSLYRARADGTEPVLLYEGSELVQGAKWSPDGKRIAFGIRAPTDTLAVVTPGGTRQFSFAFADVGELDWCGGSRFLLARVRRIGERSFELRLIDLRDGTQRVVASQALVGTACSPDGSAVVYVTPVAGSPAALLHDLRTGESFPLPLAAGVRQNFHWIADEAPPLPTGLQVMPLEGQLAWGKSTGMEARVEYSDGTTTHVPVDWHSENPRVASVSPAGVLYGNFPGSARIVASLDDWFSDTVVVHVGGDAPASVLFSDEFSTLGQWHVFGEPEARSTTVDGGPVLEITGDGMYVDGVLTRETFGLERGGTLEFEYRLDLERPVHQAITACIGDHNVSARRTLIAHTDAICFQYPAADLLKFDAAEAFFGLPATGGPIRLPEHLPAKGWVHVAIQVRPDGRGALFLNRRFVAESDLNLPGVHLDRWRVVFHGKARHTRLYVRNATLWQGLQYDVPDGAG